MKATKFACWAALATSLSLAAPLASADDKSPPAKAETKKGSTTTTSGKMGKLSDTDLQVLAHLRQGDEDEVKAGKLALQKTADGGVKSFAQMLIDDHGSDARNIESLVKKTGQNLPDVQPMNDAEKMEMQMTQETMAKLDGLSGKNFDVEFLRTQLAMHDKTLAKIDKDMTLVQDNPDLVSMLRGNRPVIVKHRDKARVLLGASNAAQARRGKK